MCNYTMLDIVLDATLLSGSVPCALGGQQGKRACRDEWPPPAPYLLPNSFTTATAHWKFPSLTKALKCAGDDQSEDPRQHHVLFRHVCWSVPMSEFRHENVDGWPTRSYHEIGKPYGNCSNAPD
jgi:hypothetical protein